VEIIRFDGINSGIEAIKTLLAGEQQLGVAIQLQPAQPIRIGGVDGVGFQGQRVTSNGGVYSIGIYLIPTPKGIVTVNFVCSPMTMQAALPTLQKILASIQVAK